MDLTGANTPELSNLLTRGANSIGEAQTRYEDLLATQPKSLACLLNIATVMTDIHLPVGSALDYFQELIWDGQSILQDRFFAYADKKLLGQIKQATTQGQFTPEPFPELFHPGATASFKQVQFGEANLQLTFHEHDTSRIGEIDCVKVEVDLDYYKDPLAHALLEVLPNHFNGPTDPKAAYVLRWIAGRHAGVREFDPPYTIA